MDRAKGPGGRFGRRPGLSVVLRGAQGVRDGQPVTVTLGSGRTIEGYARVIGEGEIRVQLPDGVS